MSIIRIRTPATTANLGAGFDSLGLALSLYNEVTIEAAGQELEITATGEGAAALPRGPANIVVRAMQHVFGLVGRPLPPLRLHQHNGIPLTRGLGSSSAAIVAGLAGANALLGDPLSTPELVDAATTLDGHPDNVTPCLVGGFSVAALEGSHVHYARLPVPDTLEVVLYIPEFETSTPEARSQLPDAYSRDDAVFSLSRAALITAAFATGEWQLLRVGMQDCLHQPYRSRRFPEMPHLVAAALDAGALGAALSGSGPTIAAFTVGECRAVAGALEAAGAALGLSGRAVCVLPDANGAQVTRDE